MNNRSSVFGNYSMMEGAFRSSEKAVFMRPTNSFFQRPVVKGKPPIVLHGDVPSEAGLTFIDVVGDFTAVDWDRAMQEKMRFSSLVSTANDWLKNNKCWRVLSCETALLIKKQEAVDKFDEESAKKVFQGFTDYESGEYVLVKSLRLWLKKRNDLEVIKGDGDYQTIGHLMLKPKCNKTDDQRMEWQTMDEVVDSINNVLASQINEPIVSIECVECDADDEWHFDPETLFLKIEPVNKVKVINLFYLKNELRKQTKQQKVGFFDFEPKQTTTGAVLSRPFFESIDQVLAKVSEFLNQNDQLELINLQLLDFKLRPYVNTKMMVDSNDNGNYMRVMRAFCWQNANASTQQQHQRQHQSAPENYCNHSKKSPICIHSKSFETLRHSSVHGAFYFVKRTLDKFVEGVDCDASKSEPLKVISTSTSLVIAKDDADMFQKKGASVYSNRPNILTSPKIYTIKRIFYDVGAKGLKKRETSESAYERGERSSYYKRQLSSSEACSIS